MPIQPQFYRTLFKDANLRQPSLFDNHDYGLDEVQGNTIVKAYICNAPRTDLESDDLLFFYASKKYKSIEALGVLLEHKRVDNLAELWEMVRSKTVYSKKELEKRLAERKYVTVLIFRLVQYLKTPIDFKSVKELKSWKSKFQIITKLEEEDYKHIKENYINESFIIN